MAVENDEIRTNRTTAVEDDDQKRRKHERKPLRSKRTTGNGGEVRTLRRASTQRPIVPSRMDDEVSGELQLQNMDIIVADISTFEMEASYDRIFSIEMFEHMKNYKDLLNKISKWMKEDGLLFDDVTVVNHWLVNGKHYTQT
ncbi:hypothetical protein RYX36_033469, partial [Vicia faba]